MRIAVTDACIFIDLLLLDLIQPFFALNIEVHTSLDVFYELNDDQRRTLSEFITLGKLTVHTIHSPDRLAMLEYEFPRSLSEMDCTVLYLAARLEAMVLSSDKVVRNYAKTHSIDYHGMLWIFDQMVSNDCISPTTAISKLRRLMTSNYIYQNNAILLEEMNKRLKMWGGKEV